MFNKGFNAVFMTRPFWAEMNVPQSIVFKIYKEYLGTASMIIASRTESIEYISPVVNRLQKEILDWVKSTNTNQVIKDLYQIFDKCFGFYIAEKEARKRLVELNIADDILDAFTCNRNMAVNVLNSVNLWLENTVLYQNEADPTQVSEDSTTNCELFVKLYLYGLTSKTLSLLSLSKKFEEKELFYGIDLSLESNEPIDVMRYHPVIYYNPALTGNQDAFNLTVRSFSALLYVLVYPLFPVGAERFTGTDRAYRFADDIVIQRSSFLVALVVHGPVGADAETFSLSCGVDVGTQEEELPAVLFLLLLDHLAHLFVVVALAGVFVAVGGDDE